MGENKIIKSWPRFFLGVMIGLVLGFIFFEKILPMITN